MPTYGYDLAQAVQDGFLVDFMSVETQLKFIQQGIVYDELSEEDRLVGIISHVDSLRSRIDRQIEVTKDRDAGSRAVIKTI